MTGWPIFKIGDTIANADCLVSKYIIEALGVNLQEFFSYSPNEPAQRTRIVKSALSKLAHEEKIDKAKFKVMSNRLPHEMRLENGGEFRNTEWLYDLHWYEENNHYQMTSLPLVVECEWEWDRTGDTSNDDYCAVKWDFQKLLASNADLRVIIFRKRPADVVNSEWELHEYFSNTINSYRNLAHGSKFLFIAFDDQMKCFHYTNFTKSLP